MTASTPNPPTTPRFAPIWAMLICALAALTLAHPALAGQFLVGGISDQYIAGYAFREYAASSLSAGRGFPLWNPYLFGGMPYVAAMHGDIFYPTFLLRLLLGADAGMSWGMILHVWLAGVLTYAFLRASGLSFWASIIGGLAYMMSGPIAGLVSPGHDGKIFVSALFPLMLLCLTWGIRDGKAWAWGALMLVSGLGVLTPHPQLYQYMLLAAGAYALLLAFGGAVVLERAVAIKRLGLSLAGILGGWLIGAIQFVPVFEYVPWSPRAEGKGWEHAVSYSMPPEELINGYLPQFSGILDSYWGRNGIHFHSDYIGVVVLMLASAGLLWGRRKEAWFWAGFLVVAILWSLGGFTPFYSLVYALVPGAKFFRAPSTFFYLAQFAIAVLAARGTERLFSEGLPRKHAFAWTGFGVLMVLLAASGSLRDLFLGVVPEGRMTQFSDASARDAMSAGSLRSLGIVLAVVAVWFAVQRKKLTAQVAGAVLVILTTADLWSIERLYWNFSKPAAEIYRSDAIIDYIKRQPEPGRVMTLQFHGYAERDAFLSGDALMSHDLRLVTGYHGNEIGRYQELVGFEDQLRASLSSGQSPAFWRVTNTRWIIYDDSTVAFPGTERVMGPVLNAAGHPVWLFKVTAENPTAWVTAAIMKQPDDVVRGALADPRFPTSSVALFPPDAQVVGQALTAAPTPLAIKANVPVLEPGRISVELSGPAPAGSALIVAENFYPGWSATIDGQPGAVQRADLSLMGVPLPTGATKIELTFASTSYERGKLLTLLGLAVAALAMGAGVVVGRRSAHG